MGERIAKYGFDISLTWVRVEHVQGLLVRDIL